MEDSRFEKVAELFEGARNVAPAERRSWLEQACGDEGLREEVRSLLREHEAESLELDPSTRVDALRRWVGASLNPDSETGDWQPPSFEVPGFRILSLLGEGGMGTVYEAEQDRPRRTVALKILRPHMDGSSMGRRFEQEADILARLQHPGIATVHGAGMVETDMGPLPYFAMELVRGKTLTKYATSTKLSRDEKLELVAKIGDAVAHAHGQGVVHRDLKPSNILVDQQGMPRVLDFGIARVTDSDVQVTRQTDAGQVLGTLAYMSPEQAAGRPEDIDERSDVFSLGVIAFELLCGRLPRDVSGLAFPEALRRLMDGETTLLGHMDRTLGGDVETVVAKALAGEKERRYSRVSEFSDDLRRFLRSEPIRARRATALYHLGRFMRRHRLVSGLLIALFVVLVVGTVTSTSLFLDAREKAAALLWGNYTATLGNISSSMRFGEGRDVEVLLESCAPEHRGWEWEWLASRADSSLQVFEDPASPGFSGNSFLWASAYDPGGAMIVSSTAPSGSLGGKEYALRRWSTDGELLQSMTAGCRTLDIAFSAEGGQFATTGFDTDHIAAKPPETALWELGEDEPNVRIPFGGFFVAPWPGEDGLWALGAPDGVHLWEPGSGRPSSLLAAPLAAACFSPDGEELLAVRQDGTLQRWDTQALLMRSFEGGPLEPLSELTLPVRQEGSGPVAVAASPAGDRVAVGLANGALFLVNPGAEPRTLRSPGEVGGALLFVGEEHLVSAGKNGNLHLWKASTGSLISTFFGHDATVTSLTSSSAEGEFLTTSRDRTLRRWSTRANASERSLDARSAPFQTTNAFDMAFAPDGSRFAWHVEGFAVQVIETASGRVVFEVDHERTDSMLNQVAFGPLGERLYTSNVAGEVRVWGPTGELLDVHQTGCPTARLDTASGLAAFNEVPEFNPTLDDPTATPTRVVVRDLASWELLSSFELPAIVDAMQFSRDGSRLIGGCYGGEVFVAEPRSGQVLWTHQIPEMHAGNRTAPLVAVDAQGQRLAFSLFDPVDTRLFLWEPGVAPEPRLISESLRAVGMSFHPDGSRLAVGTFDGDIHLFDPAGEAIVNLGGVDSLVAVLAFSHDGSILATAHPNGLHKLLRP